jgi:hypothetical protein
MFGKSKRVKTLEKKVDSLEQLVHALISKISRLEGHRI